MKAPIIYFLFILSLFISLINTAIAQDFSYHGLRGEYFTGKSFTNCSLRRFDPQTDFNWGFAAPDVTLKTDSFAVL